MPVEQGVFSERFLERLSCKLSRFPWNSLDGKRGNSVQYENLLFLAGVLPAVRIGEKANAYNKSVDTQGT